MEIFFFDDFSKSHGEGSHSTMSGKGAELIDSILNWVEKKGGLRLFRQILTVKKMEKKQPSRMRLSQAALESQQELAMKNANPWAEVISAKVVTCKAWRLAIFFLMALNAHGNFGSTKYSTVCRFGLHTKVTVCGYSCLTTML